MRIQHAKRQGWEQGSKQGLEGIRGGEMERPRHGRRNGTEGSRVMCHMRAWARTTPTRKGPASKSGQDSAKARCCCFCCFYGDPNSHTPYSEGEDSGEEPVVPRGPEWVGEHVRRPSSRTGPYCHRGSLVSNISDPHPAGDPSLVQICSLRWMTHPYHSQTQRSSSSRHSSGRTRIASDSTTIRGNPTTASV